MGNSSPTSSNTWRTANSAALAFNVSNTVSIKIMSTPPAISARVTSQYAVTSSSKLIFRNPGSFTSGDSDAVRLVGPKAPATKRCTPLAALHSSATLRARRADSRFSSPTSACRP